MQIYSGLPAALTVGFERGDFAPVLQLFPPPLSTGNVLLMSSTAEGVLAGLPSFDSVEDARGQVAAFLGQYPTLQGWSFASDPADPLRLEQYEGSWIVRLRWQVDRGVQNPGATDRHQRVLRAGTAVPGIDGLRVLPSIKVGDLPLAPIISWWALLFAASMMARYEPDAWLETLRVDYSPLAAPIEALLEAALSQVPTLILSCLSEPTQLVPEAAP